MGVVETTCRGSGNLPNSVVLEVTRPSPPASNGEPARHGGHPKPAIATPGAQIMVPVSNHDWGEDQNRHAQRQLSRQESLRHQCTRRMTQLHRLLAVLEQAIFREFKLEGTTSTGLKCAQSVSPAAP